MLQLIMPVGKHHFHSKLGPSLSDFWDRILRCHPPTFLQPVCNLSATPPPCTQLPPQKFLQFLFPLLAADSSRRQDGHPPQQFNFIDSGILFFKKEKKKVGHYSTQIPFSSPCYPVLLFQTQEQNKEGGEE